MQDTDWLAGAPTEARNRGGRRRTNNSGRLLKLECSECGFLARASAGAIRSAGLPACGCGAPLELPEARDRARLDWDAFADELARMTLRDQNALYRELGYLDLVIPLDSHGHIAGGGSDIGGERIPQTCQWDGGYCSKFVKGRYCPEHTPRTRAHELERGA